MSSDEEETETQQKTLAGSNADQDEGNGYDTLIDHYKKLIEYKNNMFKTDALLAIEKDSMIQEELNKVRASLLQAISYEEDVIKFTQNSDDYYFSPDLLDNKYIDRLCRCYLKHENRWYNAKIESVDIESQEAEATIIGSTERMKVHACFVKLIPCPDPINFQVGTQCEAIYGGDGKYYPCAIEKITEAGYHVKFRKYNNKEIVSLYHLKKVENDNTIPNMSDMKEYKVPDHLKILPNDSEAERKKKKKKQKALKTAFKVQQIEKATTEKQSQWTNFNQKSLMKKKGHFQGARESIFKSPDTVEGKVGVTGSGKIMTGYGQRLRYVFEDGDPNAQNQNNPNMSKLY